MSATSNPAAIRKVTVGDHLTIHTTNGDVEGEVDDVSRSDTERTKGVTVHFEPVGSSAKDDADGFRISFVRSLPSTPWEVGKLLAEVYREERLDYEFQERGRITGFVSHDADEVGA